MHYFDNFSYNKMSCIFFNARLLLEGLAKLRHYVSTWVLNEDSETAYPSEAFKRQETTDRHSTAITSKKFLALTSATNNTNFLHPVHRGRLFSGPLSKDGSISCAVRPGMLRGHLCPGPPLGNNNGNGVLVIVFC